MSTRKTRKTPTSQGGHGKTKPAHKLLCTVPECGRPAYARGLCQSHNRQMRTLGRVEPIHPYRPRSQGTVKYDQFRVTSLCADKLTAYAVSRGLTPGAAIAEVLEDWAARRRKKGGRRV
jgi:hypothetical protein